MKVFIALSILVALASANQSSHQTIQHGNAAPVHTSIHKPHGSYHASVVSQPHAAPQDIHNPYAPHKTAAKVHAPAHGPHHAAPYHPAPYHPAPHHPAPHHPAPYHPAPYHPAPAPYHPAPVVHKPAPYHPAPIVHKPAPYHPAPYHEPAYDAPPAYNYGYAVADDYSGTNFAQNESRDGYSTNGEYRVALPDGRTQIVSYTVGDAYSGYVADVHYEGDYKPAYHA